MRRSAVVRMRAVHARTLSPPARPCELQRWGCAPLYRGAGRGCARALSSSSASTPLLTHGELRATVRAFIAAEVNPHVNAWEAAGIFPAQALFKKMGDAGLLGLNKPAAYGGLALPFSYALVMAEETGGIRCGGVPMAIGVQTDMATPALARFGSPELCERILAPTIAGDLVACLGVSEVGAGSDVAAVTTRAKLDVDGATYTINGGKMWTTNGTQADWMCTLVNTEGDGQSAPHGNKTLIVVPMDAAGVSVAPRFEKLGMRSSDTTAVTLEDVRVPAANVIGEPGQGFSYQMVQFQEERLVAGTVDSGGRAARHRSKDFGARTRTASARRDSPPSDPTDVSSPAPPAAPPTIAALLGRPQLLGEARSFPRHDQRLWLQRRRR